MHARAECIASCGPQASGVPTRIAAQNREISCLVAAGRAPDGASGAATDAVPLLVLSGLVSDDSAAGPESRADTCTPVWLAEDPSSNSCASFSFFTSRVALVPKNT